MRTCASSLPFESGLARWGQQSRKATTTPLTLHNTTSSSSSLTASSSPSQSSSRVAAHTQRAIPSATGGHGEDIPVAETGLADRQVLVENGAGLVGHYEGPGLFWRQ